MIPEVRNGRFARSPFVFWGVLFVHAVVTWPVEGVVALLGGGALLTFVAEWSVIRVGWLQHHIGTRIAGVPLYVLVGFPGVVYGACRIALLGTSGVTAVGAAAVLATTYDVPADQRGVTRGHWEHTDDLPAPRFRGAPWWNFLGWVVLSVVMASLTLPYR